MNSNGKLCRRVVYPLDYLRLVADHHPELERIDFEDLSGNVPGASLRQKSSEMRKASPSRVLLSKVLGVHTEERAWRRGAAGEEEVARQLDKLGSNWHVIHSVPVGSKNTDIDHVVFGPPGVFALNTKNHLGKRVTVYDGVIYVSGVKQPYLNKSRAEGKRASKLLSSGCGLEVVVHPVIVIMATELVFKSLPIDVNVVGRRKIADWLSRRTPQLSSDQVKLIYSAACQRSTWVS